MSVMVGSARSDENGKANSGRAGDQTGKEVSTQSWYKHSKGWRVIRAIDPVKRADIADQMKFACDNPHIGYDQWQRDTLLKQVKDKGFDVRKAETDCETDCSALVRVCVAHAYGYDVAAKVMGDARWSTLNMCGFLIKSGLFVEMTGSKYTDYSDYLCKGDILCTRTQGHTVVVLNDGIKAEKTIVEPVLFERMLENGCAGADVKELQENLILLGYDCGRWGADGDFGDATEIAVMQFQKDNGLEVDGQFGNKSKATMKNALEQRKNDLIKASVHITGGQCWVRKEPSLSGEKLWVAKENSEWKSTGEVVNGFVQVVLSDGSDGWVSQKYGLLV